MIVPMKKIHIIVEKKDALAALERLRETGVVHIEHLAEIKGQTLAEHQHAIGQLEKALQLLGQIKPKLPQEPCLDASQECRNILELIENIDRLKDSIAKRAIRIKLWEPWGNFEPEDIRSLIPHNVFVELFEIPIADLPKLPSEVFCKEIGREGGIARCAVILRENIVLPYQRVTPPAMSLEDKKAIQEEETVKLEMLEAELRAKVKYADALAQELYVRQQELRFKEARLGMREEDQLSVLKGYCPKRIIEQLDAAARQEKWGLIVEDPADDDRVPTLIENPKWIDIVKPVFRVINVLPGYKELDISLVFLIFFSIFFGILIGDAGYGSIFLILTAFAQFKLRNKLSDQSPFVLMYVLSSVTILWGLLTGTVFGTLLLGDVIKPMIAWLTETKNVELFCFLIGALHLSIAHFWRFLNKFPSLAMLGELGWIVVIWGGFAAAAMMILGVQTVGSVDIMTYIKWLIGGGAALVVFDILLQDKKAIFVNLILFVFGCISAFTDVVSYVRLFAVGLASVAVADAFNQMALNFGFNNVVSGTITALILIVGHLFNIVLCGFGILVHGLRLNVLEFSGHLGLEWAGFKYDPLKKVKTSLN